MEGMSEGLSFRLTEEQEAFRQSVRELVEDKIRPRAAEIDATDEFPWDIDELMIKNGFAGVSYPEEYGGAGGGAVELCLLVEEVSKASGGVALITAVNKLGAIPVLLAGSEEMKKKVCTGITNGEHRMSYCLTEPNSGSDAAGMRSRGSATATTGSSPGPSASSRGPGRATSTRTSPSLIPMRRRARASPRS